MTYIEKTLVNDESIVIKIKQHWINYVLAGMYSIVIIGIPFLLAIMFREYALTTNRVIAKTGLISRNTQEMKLNKIENVTINQSILGRILNFGSITISGTGSGKVFIKSIVNPLEVKRKIDSMLTN
jgi:uncharacterized membrane protein YdbT with pleckstrin-like domain